jgi:hypothetical protein
VLDIALKGVEGALLEIYPAKAEIAPLVAEEAGALLHGVGVADADAARHVGDGETFDGEAPVHCLPADEYPAVGAAPVHVRRAAAARIDLEDARVPEGEAEGWQ